MITISFFLRHKKMLSFLFVFFLIFLLGLYIFEYRNDDTQSYMLETEIHIFNDNNDEVITVESTNDEICFYSNFIFKSSTDLDGNLILLKNFKPCAFSLNGSDYSESYKIDIPSSENYLSSRENSIKIRDLNLSKNDMCFVLVVDDLIITKRFQITNSISTKKNIINNQDCFLINQEMDSTSLYMSNHFDFVDFKRNQMYLDDVIKNGKLYCALNIKNKFVDSQFEFDFKNRKKEEIQYAAIPVGYYNEDFKFFDPIFFKTNYETFGFEMEATDMNDLSGIRFIIFPFANEYSEEFLSTYKAVLWFSPIVTHIIFKEDVK